MFRLTNSISSRLFSYHTFSILTKSFSSTIGATLQENNGKLQSFIQSIVDEESYFKKRSLIFNQMKYVYRIKFRNAKLPRIFKLIDSCYDKYSNSNEDEFMKIKKILKLLGDRITKNDY